MVLVSLSCLATVTVLNIHFKGNGDTTIPRWLKVGFYIPLTKIMCMADIRKKWKCSSASIRVKMSSFLTLNPLPNYNFVDWTKFKTFLCFTG